MGEEKPDEELMGNVSLLRGCLRHFRMSMIIIWAERKKFIHKPAKFFLVFVKNGRFVVR
jgi:hypothetical protein